MPTPVGWLRCFRGIDILTAITILAELHDFRRFESARALMAYVGLVPSEHSSGAPQRRGPITKTGNVLVRRVLIEAGWHYQQRSWDLAYAATAAREAARPRDRGQGAATLVSPVSTARDAASADAESRRRHRARTCGVHLGGVAPCAGNGVNSKDAADVRRGPRRRRMMSGTIRRTSELVLRQGRHMPRTRALDCAPSRRSTVIACSASARRGNHRISA